MTDKNTAGIDLDTLEARALELHGVRMFSQEHFSLMRQVAMGTMQLIALARRAEPSVTEADERARVHEEDDAFTEWWNAVQACPEHSLITENAARATWHERARRAALASPAVSQKDGAAVDAYAVARAVRDACLKVSADFRFPETMRAAEALFKVRGLTSSLNLADIIATCQPAATTASQQIGVDTEYAEYVNQCAEQGKPPMKFATFSHFGFKAKDFATQAATTASAADPAKCGCNVCFAAANAGGPFAVAARNRTLTDEEVAALDINPWAATTASASGEGWGYFIETVRDLTPEQRRAPAPSRDADKCNGCEGGCDSCPLDEKRAAVAQQSASQAPQIKTWQERIHADTKNYNGLDEEDKKYMLAEIVDLRAALARAPLPAQGGGFTDAQIIAALHANGIDTYPSKYGFDAVQVSATSVPALRKVIEFLAAPAQAQGGTSDGFYVVYGDDDAVDLFAQAMKDKMKACRAKGRGGWHDPDECPSERLQGMLIEHLAKGDPVDVANFAMMLWNRGDRAAKAASHDTQGEKNV